jgi:hypothetical protein
MPIASFHRYGQGTAVEKENQKIFSVRGVSTLDSFSS